MTRGCTGSYAALVQRLLANQGCCVEFDDLTQAMFPDPDTQPEDAKRSVRLAVFRARNRGWRIVSRRQLGYILV